MIRSIGVLLTLPCFLGLGTHVIAQDTVLPTNPPPAVNLAPDDCALFVWVGYPSRLAFIIRASERLAFSAQDRMTPYSVSPAINLGQGPDKFGQYANQDLLGKDGDDSQLRLGAPTDMSKFVYYPSGTMTLPSADGWLHIESAQAVSACNDAAAAKSISLDEMGGSFAVPSWLNTPARLAERNTRKIVEIDIPPGTQVLPAVAITAPPLPVVEPSLVAPAETLPPAEIAPPLEAFAPSLTPDFVPEPIPEPIPDAIIAPIAEPVVGLPPRHTVQIGAYPSELGADQAWTRFQQTAEYLHQKQRVVQLANIKNLGQVYRLRVTGFVDHGSAVNFCNRLKADNIECYVPVGR